VREMCACTPVCVCVCACAAVCASAAVWCKDDKMLSMCLSTCVDFNMPQGSGLTGKRFTKHKCHTYKFIEDNATELLAPIMKLNESLGSCVHHVQYIKQYACLRCACVRFLVRTLRAHTCRRLIEDGLSLLRDPAFQAIEQVRLCSYLPFFYCAVSWCIKPLSRCSCQF